MGMYKNKFGVPYKGYKEIRLQGKVGLGIENLGPNYNFLKRFAFVSEDFVCNLF